MSIVSCLFNYFYVRFTLVSNKKRQLYFPWRGNEGKGERVKTVDSVMMFPVMKAPVQKIPVLVPVENPPVKRIR